MVLSWLSAACPQLDHLELHVTDPDAVTTTLPIQPQQQLLLLPSLRSLKLGHNVGAAAATAVAVLRRLPALSTLALEHLEYDGLSPLLGAVAAAATGQQPVGQLTSLQLDNGSFHNDTREPWYQLHVLLCPIPDEDGDDGEVGVAADWEPQWIAYHEELYAEADADIKAELAPLLAAAPVAAQPFGALQKLIMPEARIFGGVWTALREAARPGGAMPALTHLTVSELWLARACNTAATAPDSALRHLTLTYGCILHTLAYLPLGVEGGGVRRLAFGTLCADVDEGDEVPEQGFVTDYDWLMPRVLANLARCGDTQPACHVVDDGKLHVRARSVRVLSAVLKVVPYVAGVRSLSLGTIGGDLTRGMIAALAAAPPLPPSITTLDFSRCRSSDSEENVWPALLPAITASPSLAGVEQVEVSGSTMTPEQLQLLCCAPGGTVARPVLVTVQS